MFIMQKISYYLVYSKGFMGKGMFTHPYIKGITTGTHVVKTA